RRRGGRVRRAAVVRPAGAGQRLRPDLPVPRLPAGGQRGGGTHRRLAQRDDAGPGEPPALAHALLGGPGDPTYLRVPGLGVEPASAQRRSWRGTTTSA